MVFVNRATVAVPAAPAPECGPLSFCFMSVIALINMLVDQSLVDSCSPTGGVGSSFQKEAIDYRQQFFSLS